MSEDVIFMCAMIIRFFSPLVIIVSASHIRSLPLLLLTLVLLQCPYRLLGILPAAGMVTGVIYRCYVAAISTRVT